MTHAVEPASPVPATSPLDVDAEQFLLELLDTPAPSGFEGPAAELWCARARALGLEVERDRLGSSYATAGAGASRRVALVGHLDEIGLIVSKIDDKGFIRVANIGGWDVAVLVGQRVRIVGADGPVSGTLVRAAVHTLDAEARSKVPKLRDMWIDIGAEDGEAARSRVRIGDPAVLDVAPVRLSPTRIASRSCDNRIGSFIVLEVARRCGDLGIEVTAVGTVAEEIGGWGALTSTTRLAPEAALVVDVTSPGDTPSAGHIADLSLGKGPIVTRGATTNRPVVDRLIALAGEEGIDIQLRGLGLRTATDTDQVVRAGAGVAAGLVSIPGRYLHSPCEQVDLRDVDAAIRLMCAWVADVAKATV